MTRAEKAYREFVIRNGLKATPGSIQREQGDDFSLMTEIAMSMDPKDLYKESK